MPLKAGKKNFSSNMEEMMGKYKMTGKMSSGKIKPRNKKHARRIALAAAYSQMKGGK